MDIRIGNDIRIDVSLENLGIPSASDIVNAEGILINMSDPTECCWEYCDHSKYTIRQFGIPAYNVYPHTILAHLFFNAPSKCGVCFDHRPDHCKHCSSKCEIHTDTYLSEETSSICMYYSAEDQKCGEYKLVLKITIKQSEWGGDDLHTCTFDYGRIFKLVCSPHGKCGSIVINLPKYQDFDQNIFTTGDFHTKLYKITAIPDYEERGKVTGSGEYGYGNVVTISAKAYQYYKFIGWSDGEESATRNITVAGDAMYTALFDDGSGNVNVYFYDEDGVTLLQHTELSYGTAIIPPTPPTKDGYIFNGWNPSVNRYTPDHDVTYIATYIEATYTTITISANNYEYGTVTPEGENQVVVGTPVTVTATPNEHYRFVKWNDGVTDPIRTITASEDASYIAEFAPIEYIVTFRSEGNGTIYRNGEIFSGGSFEYGSQITILAEPDLGCAFDTWSDGNTEQERTFTITGDDAIVARFTINQYTITVVSADSTMGTVTGGGTQNYNTSMIISATPKTGYVFDKWNDDNTSASRSVTVDGNKTYTAYFKLDTPMYYYGIDTAANLNSKTKSAIISQSQSSNVSQSSNQGIYTITNASSLAFYVMHTPYTSVSVKVDLGGDEWYFTFNSITFTKDDYIVEWASVNGTYTIKEIIYTQNNSN